MITETTSNTPEAAEAASVLPIVKIRVGDIVPDPKNRKNHDPAELHRLAESIKTDGLLQPITVRRLAACKVWLQGSDSLGWIVYRGEVGALDPIHADIPSKGEADAYAAVYKAGGYMIVAGERRWCAHQLLSLAEIEARVVVEGETDLQTKRKRAAENLHRENLTCIEEAEVFADLATSGMTQPEIAAFAGKKSQSTVSNSLRLLKLPAKVRGWLQEGELDRSYGVALCRWSAWPKVCEAIAKELLDDDHMTAKQFEGQKLPYSHLLERAGLVVRIDIGPYGPGYKLPANDTDYFKAYDHLGYCFAPTKWAEEKKSQDAQIKAKEATAAARADKKAGKGKVDGAKATAAEIAAAAERKKVIERNKAKKAKTAGTWIMAMQAIRDCKVPESVLVAYILEDLTRAIGCRRIKEGFDRAGVKAPAGVIPGESSYGFQCPKGMQKLSARQLLGVAASVVMERHVDQALKNAFEVPDSVVDVARFHEGAGATTDTRILGEWAKAHAKGMPLAEIARSYSAKIEDVAGALGVPVPVANPKVEKDPQRRAIVEKVAAKAPAIPREKKRVAVVVSDEVRQQVKTLTEAGRTLAEISKATGLSTSAVYRVRQELGLVKWERRDAVAKKGGK